MKDTVLTSNEPRLMGQEPWNYAARKSPRFSATLISLKLPEHVLRRDSPHNSGTRNVLIDECVHCPIAC